MAEVQKIVKGGFRATLALIISIIALILSIVAFNRTGGPVDMDARIKSLNEKMNTMKQETSRRMDKVFKETKKGLEILNIEIEKKGARPESQKPEEKSSGRE